MTEPSPDTFARYTYQPRLELRGLTLVVTRSAAIELLPQIRERMHEARNTPQLNRAVAASVDEVLTRSFDGDSARKIAFFTELEKTGAQENRDLIAHNIVAGVLDAIKGAAGMTTKPVNVPLDFDIEKVTPSIVDNVAWVAANLPGDTFDIAIPVFG